MTHITALDTIRTRHARLSDVMFVSLPAVSRKGRRIKRIEDIVLSLLLLAFGMPLFLLIAVLIKLDSAGPVFFRQTRRGLRGETFSCIKFRTMQHKSTDHHCRQQTQRNDPRVTRVGKFLRAKSLDELPQLINVLRGEMSLVGPRPHALGTSIDGTLLEHVLEDYMLRYAVKPGLTGWAQVNGSRGNLDTAEKLRKRVDYDLQYIKNWSIALDLKIVFRTFFCIWSDKEAF